MMLSVSSSFFALKIVQGQNTTKFFRNNNKKTPQRWNDVLVLQKIYLKINILSMLREFALRYIDYYE